MSVRWLLTSLLLVHSSYARQYDPCAAISGKRWVAPAEARACLQSFPVNTTVKDNIIDVVNKTLAFHTSVNYQISAPPPFENQVHEDLVADLNRISISDYPSEFAFHLDIFQTFRRANDGHCVVLNLCYDSAFVTYLPLPLVLLHDRNGLQNVYIAPEAYNVSKGEFDDQLEYWENALPGELKGNLKSLAGAKVLFINGQDPFVAVDANARVAGGYQSFATRQNSFFSSYSISSAWSYVMGNFAQRVHPLTDSVELTVVRPGKREPETFAIPFRSRLGSGTRAFNDSSSFYENNCKAHTGTNGWDLYEDPALLDSFEEIVLPQHKFEQQPTISLAETRRHPMNVMMDATPLSNIPLPPEAIPGGEHLEESWSVAQFYLLGDKVTGVLALGSFSAPNYTKFGTHLLSGLQKLKELGAKRLVIDVTNNGGGYICIAHYLHRIVAGPKDTTEPQAGLDSQARAGPLARAIVKSIVQGGDPEELLSYNPVQWRNASNDPFRNTTNWLEPPVEVIINGHDDAFSQRLGQECQPFSFPVPPAPLFDPASVVIVTNGRCASSCSLFTITMKKLEGVRTVVVGGKTGVEQQYCGVVGGQSTNYVTVDTEIKSAKLAGHLHAPPDLLSNVIQGITWRLGFGIDNPTIPEEWQNHAASHNLALTFESVNKPERVWQDVAAWAFASADSRPHFQFQTQM